MSKRFYLATSMSLAGGLFAACTINTAPPPDPGPHCTVGFTDESCRCELQDYLDPNEFSCDASKFERGYCCATSFWPSEGAVCDCEGGGPSCEVDASGYCSCGKYTYDFANAVDSCGPPDGGVCCLSSDSCSCTHATSCTEGVQVETCLASDISPYCPDGFVVVDDCRQ